MQDRLGAMYSTVRPDAAVLLWRKEGASSGTGAEKVKEAEEWAYFWYRAWGDSQGRLPDDVTASQGQKLHQLQRY